MDFSLRKLWRSRSKFLGWWICHNHCIALLCAVFLLCLIHWTNLLQFSKSWWAIAGMGWLDCGHCSVYGHSCDGPCKPVWRFEAGLGDNLGILLIWFCLHVYIYIYIYMYIYLYIYIYIYISPFIVIYPKSNCHDLCRKKSVVLIKRTIRTALAEDGEGWSMAHVCGKYVPNLKAERCVSGAWNYSLFRWYRRPFGIRCSRGHRWCGGLK